MAIYLQRGDVVCSVVNNPDYDHLVLENFDTHVDDQLFMCSLINI